MTDIVNYVWFGALATGLILLAIRFMVDKDEDNPKNLLGDLQTLAFTIFVIGFVIRIIIGVIPDSSPELSDADKQRIESGIIYETTGLEQSDR